MVDVTQQGEVGEARAPGGPARSGLPLNYLLPFAAGLFFLAAWQMIVTVFHVPRFLVPSPLLIAQTIVTDAPSLLKALQYTAIVTLSAFSLAVITGIVFGVILAQSRTVEMTLWPFAVMMQVTPVIAIAPLVVIWVGLDNVWLALLILAWLVAFFPMLSNTALGMKSADHGLRNVFQLYGASRWKRFRYLSLPSALPYILGGARISAGLSVIGAVVAEFQAGTGSATGLAWTIVEAGTTLNVPRMFAALFLLTAFGLSIWYATTLLQRFLLRHWHESELRLEN
jgi:NitT/TauT family transport system permease protein